MIIGLTGIIGSGKSTVSIILASMGAYCIDCDNIVKDLYCAGNKGYKAVKDNLGDDFVDSEGVIFEKLRVFVFKNEKNRIFINSLIHPLVVEKIREKIDSVQADFYFIEAPLLFEAGLDAICDRIWVVIADENIRVARIMERDGCSEEDARARINAQHTDDFFIEHADVIIHNDSGINELERKVKELINE